MEKKEMLKIVLLIIGAIGILLLLTSPFFVLSYLMGAKLDLIESNSAFGDLAIFYGFILLVVYLDWYAYRKFVKGK